MKEKLKRKASKKSKNTFLCKKNTRPYRAIIMKNNNCHHLYVSATQVSSWKAIISMGQDKSLHTIIVSQMTSVLL